MPTHNYRTKNRKRVPSVTTILGKFKDPGALMYWSWNVAYEQLAEAVGLLQSKASTQEVRAFLKTKPLDLGNYRFQALKAADAGTVAHKLVETWIHARLGEKLNLSNQSPRVIASNHNLDLDTATKAYSSFHAFLDWTKTYKIKVRQTEAALISEEYHFGGCIDCIAILDRKLILLDWKTSKAVYPDYLCQLAAYGILWNENNPDNKITSYHLLRFDKSTADFHHHQFAELKDAAEMFLLLRQCYDLQASVERRVK